MSTILRSLKATFPHLPIVCSALPTHRLHPDKLTASHDKLADQLAALANRTDGGLLVLGLAPYPPHSVRGVRHPKAWMAALHELAGHLVPPLSIEVEAGQEEEQTIIVAQVPYLDAAQRSVHRRGAPPCRLVSGQPESWFAPLPKAPTLIRPPPLLEPVADSTPLWFDPDVTHRLRHYNAEGWSSAHRAALAREGLLAGDGVRLTHAGLLLAGLPEHRSENAAIIVEREGHIEVLEQGWLLVHRSLRRELLAAGTPHHELVVDLILEVLARTAGPGLTQAPTIDLSPGLVTIEAGARLTGDDTLMRLLAGFSSWRPGRWRELATKHHHPITSDRGGCGLRVQVHPILEEKPRTKASCLAKPRPILPPALPTVPVAAPELPPVEPSAPTAPQLPRETREAAVLALLADGHPRSRRELDAKLGWSRSTLRNVLEALIHSGRIATEASSPRSPHQAYRAI